MQLTWTCALVALAVTCASIASAIKPASLPHVRAPHPIRGASQNAAPKTDGVIEAIIMPHSHDDVGWLNTISQYYDEKVKFIYDTTVESLYNDQTKFFQSVEMAYFSLWWQRATPDQQNKARTVIQRRQFVFVIGGWTMQDEACTFYMDDINQMTEGHRFIANTFGEEYLPRFSFQVDPFGASSWTAAMYKKVGFDAHLISRTNFTMKNDRQNSQTLQFVWNSQPSLGSDGYIWTHMMDQFSYTSPGHYMFDTGDPAVSMFNEKELADFLVQNIKQRAAWFRHGPVLWPFGTDFQWTNATIMFENMDKLIKYVNDRSDTLGVKLSYGTLNEYFEKMHSFNDTWPSYEGDFFPYDDEDYSWWTGYFTSRPYSKGYIRNATNTLRQAETLDQITQVEAAGGECPKTLNSEDRFHRLQVMRNFSADDTHHDAVTGTSNTWVVQMYVNNITQGDQSVEPVMLESLSELAAKKAGGCQAPQFTFDSSALNTLQPGQYVPVVVYNSLPYALAQYVSIPLNTANAGGLAVSNSTTPNVPFELLATQPPQNINSTHTLWFYAYVPPMGYSTYWVNGVSADKKTEVVKPVPRKVSDGDTVVSNEAYTMTFSGTTGRLVNVTVKATGTTVPLTQSLMSYASYDGVGVDSGAYVFRPQGEATEIATGPVQVSVALGKYVTEVYQVFANDYTQVVRLFAGLGDDDVSGAIEFEHHIGPIMGNTEIISRFQTGLNTGDEFYADSNGLTIHKRKTLPKILNPIGGNYFPMVMTSYLRDETADLQFSLNSERSHGAASLKSGELEVMLHRYTLQSDGKGPALPDTDALYHVKFNLVLGKVQDANRRRHRVAYTLNFPSVYAFGPVTSNPTDWSNTYNTQFTAMKQPFPENLFLTSFRHTNATSPLSIVRVNHLYQAGEDPELSAPVTINLADYFNAAFTGVSERTLSTGWDAADRYAKQWTWNSDLPNTPSVEKREKRVTDDDFSVTVQPTDIRTFYAQIATSSSAVHKPTGQRSTVQIKKS